MPRQVQPMAAVLNELLSCEFFNRGTPHRICHAWRGHPTQAPAVDAGFIGVLDVERAQYARGAIQQFLPMCGEKYEVFAGSLDDSRSRWNGDMRGCASAYANQIPHRDALR